MSRWDLVKIYLQLLTGKYLAWKSVDMIIMMLQLQYQVGELESYVCIFTLLFCVTYSVFYCSYTVHCFISMCVGNLTHTLELTQCSSWATETCTLFRCFREVLNPIVLFDYGICLLISLIHTYTTVNKTLSHKGSL